MVSRIRVAAAAVFDEDYSAIPITPIAEAP